MLRVAAMKKEATYIGIRQGIVAHYVDLRPIFEVCAWEQGFEGGWWWIKP